jgi:hypothetical protein
MNTLPSLSDLGRFAAAAAMQVGFLLAAGPAQATLEFSADGFDWSSASIGPWTDARCANGSCYATTISALPDQGLSVRLFQDAHDSAFGQSVAAMRGMVLVEGPAGVSFVDSTMKLRFVESSSVYGGAEFSHAIATAMAWLAVDGQNATWTVERSLVAGECGCTGSPEPGGFNMVQSAPDAITASFRLPVGRPFELSLSLYAWGQGSFIERTDGRYELGLFAGQTFFGLPIGFSVGSADWSVTNNLWCGAGCGVPPVPEPGTAALWAAGLLAVVRGLHVRRNRQDQGEFA